MKNNMAFRFKSWLDKRTFRPHKLRQVLVGCIATIALCEVACYKMLQNTVRAGELPSYVPDATLMIMATFEVVVSPFISWFGYRRRRIMVVVLMPTLVLTSASWFFLPDAHQKLESEFCPGLNNTLYTGMVRSSVIRLGSILGSCVLIMLARIAIWCHGLAYIEEYGADRVSVQLGILVFARVMALALGYHMVGLVVKTSQIIGFIVSFVLQFLQIIYHMPISTVKEQIRHKVLDRERGFLVSTSRVLSNPLAISQMLSLGLLAAAVWGYSFYSKDIIKVKFLIFDKVDAMLFFTELFQYYGILMAVLYIGLRWSAPINDQFCKLRALKQTLTMSVLAVSLFVVLAVAVSCEHGKVAGVGRALYTNPPCSSHCGCTVRWAEFSPVCVVDDMTTYLSPCQAGCRGAEDLAGLKVYKNCSCADGGRAVQGACSERSCKTADALQRMLYVLLLTFSVLGFQAHLLLVLKAVDPRDKSVGLGLAGSCTALLAFAIGHIAYSKINAATCIWSEADRCHMHSSLLPVMVGGTSAALASVSAIICLVSFIFMARAKKRPNTSTRL